MALWNELDLELLFCPKTNKSTPITPERKIVQLNIQKSVIVGNKETETF